MKQVLIKGGKVAVEEVPAPGVDPRSILVRVTNSCVSVGTELSSVRMSALPLYRRALKQPEHAARVFQLARDEGFMKTFKRVRGLLAAGLPTGYSVAGVVVEVGSDVEGFQPGDRVACAGAGIANHAEVVNVPVNLAVHVPEGVSLSDASTVTLGAIALQGVRRAEPTLGETIGVLGLGILGQLTAQLLRMAGCRVVGGDLDSDRVDQALANGMAYGVAMGDADFAERANSATDGFGLDAVIITAATESDEVVHQAFQACRKKGRVVVVGDVGLGLRRSDMYEKELDLRMSTSYGPGRYDDVYELEGHDYPLPYVRWTENRNMHEYLRQLAAGTVRLDGLTRETFPVDGAESAYDTLQREGPKPLLVVLEYDERDEALRRTTTLRQRTRRVSADRISVALVGAGGFAQGTHVPNLVRLGDDFAIRSVVSRTGATARAVAGRVEAAYATTEYEAVLADDKVDLVLIATRHDVHAQMALDALRAGKHVFVEKPLCVTPTELDAIEAFFDLEESTPLLMTGFNRRFAPATRRLTELLAGRTTPIMASYRMNVGYLPPDHWVHGPEGGGRNIGEACHVYDLFGALAGAQVESVAADRIAPPSPQWHRNENFNATVRFADGSLCTLLYTTLGTREYAKERLDVFCDGNVATLDDYKSLAVAGSKRGGWRSRTQQKGHVEELRALARALREGGPWPISLDEQLSAMRVAFAVEERL